MEKAVKKSRLRTEFIKFVMFTFLGVTVLSLAVIVGCAALRDSLLLPNSDKVYLNWAAAGSESSPEKPNYGFSMLTLADPDAVNPFYTEDTSENRSFVLSRTKLDEGDVIISVTRVYNSPEALSPDNRLLYHACGVSMVLLPVVFALAGVLICGFAFYERKLKRPIETLFEATEKIAAQDLDFSVDYRSEDELGVLCTYFEQMRRALQENNEKMWSMLVERRQLQASVAHDLRNPIAIIEGHTEYLKMNISKERLSSEKTLPVLDNISSAAKRLEHYTD
ncbi:MAG: HAMP domain-containing protein, partial [Ruminiclostridium sp.]|nr:HAMP domain-containing protein [Ruminiclostridium sp.]